MGSNKKNNKNEKLRNNRYIQRRDEQDQDNRKMKNGYHGRKNCNEYVFYKIRREISLLEHEKIYEKTPLIFLKEQSYHKG